MKKYLPHLLAGIFAACAVFLFGFFMQVRGELEAANAALAAQAGQLSGKKAEIQQANEKLGLAEATVLSRDTIISEYKDQVGRLNLEIGKLKGQLDARPQSRDSGTIVIYRQLPGGEQSSSQSGGVTKYEWQDSTGRFSLLDPDIAQSGNEVFSYKLKIKVTGYILSDPTGAIQARQVIAQEVIEHTNADGTVTQTLGAPLPIENNIYEYSPPHRDPKLSDIIRPRLYALFDTSLNPGVGVELLNFGNYFKYINIGAGPFLSIETEAFPSGIKSSLLGIGAQYTLVPPLVSTNIGLGIGIATPADNFLGRLVVTGNIVFYLTN